MAKNEYEEVRFKRKTEKREYGPNPKLVRTLNLLYMLLKGEKMDAGKYATALGCTESAVRKYIDEIRHTRSLSDEYRIFNIEYVDNKINYNSNKIKYGSNRVEYDGSKKYYRLCTTKEVFVKCLHEEVEALYLAVKYLSGMEGTPLEFLDELEEKLKKYYHEDVKKSRKKPVHLSAPKTRSKLSDLLDKINDAMVGKDKKKLIIDYIKTRETDRIRIEIVPYSLMVYDYEWYLKAFCLKDRMLKTYVINQMDIAREPVELSRIERESLPENPDLSVIHMWDWADKGVGSEPVKVVLKFTGFKAEEMRKKLVYRTEHKSQKIEEEQDGYIIVSFEVRNPFNMIPWILRHGSYVGVIEPKNLREKIKEEAGKIMMLY